MKPRFRVLGPVEVTGLDGRPVRLGGPKPRLLLATLLLSANRWVRVDALIDAMWPDRPPRSAVANLHSYVSELRRTLPPRGAGPRIERGEDSYRVLIDPGELDAEVFERWCDEATEAGGSDPASAVRLLTGALALWRQRSPDVGPAGEWDAAWLRLVERHGTAQEDLAEARLALGQHRELVGDLRALLAEQPLRERLWEQLIRALAGAGRRGDALAAYRQAYRTLTAELGVPPGVGLSQLHERLLAAETVDSKGRSVVVGG